MGFSPNSGGVSLRTFNRNFEGRSGTADAKVYLVSPETAVAAALGCPHWWVCLTPFVLFALIICADATRTARSLGVGLRAVAAAYVQLLGYGTGFIRAFWRRCVLGKGEFEAFKKNFYK